MTALARQPDDPGVPACPTCGCRCRRDPEAEALRLIRKNRGKVEPHVIARALNWSLGKLERFARLHRIDLRYTPPKEPEPRGA